MMGEAPIATCTGNALTSRFPGGAPRPPCQASACSFHLGGPRASYGPVSVRAAKLYRTSVVPCFTWSAVTSQNFAGAPISERA